MSSKLFVTYVKKGDESNITVFKKGNEQPFTAQFTHPNWDAIVKGALADDESVVDLFDIAGTIHDRFEPLSERVTVRAGELFLDGDPMDGALADQILRFLREGQTDWIPLVAFHESLQANPSDRSREQLYRWLNTHKFTITDDGMIVGYKGVHRAPKGGYVSSHAGPAIVNGVPHRSGVVPNKPGSVIAIARSQVDNNHNVACSTGLHVGNWAYARNFASVVLEVHVNPRDVVSIPDDHQDAKMRVCRYVVIGEVTAEHTKPLVAAHKADSKIKADVLAKKNPSSKAFELLLSRSERRRQSFTKMAQHEGWTCLDPSDPKSRKSWSIA